MRLASKIFFSLALIILVLVAVAVLSLRAIDRLVDTNREIATETVPLLRLAASARDAALALGRLEARYLVLRDTQYAALWEERATRAAEDLELLRALTRSRSEAAYLAEARNAFDEYRRVVAEGRTLLRGGDRRTALRLAETRSQDLIQRVETNLDALTQTRHAAVVRAQASAARLESRTWTGVLVALGAAVGLALLSTAILAHRMTRSLSRLSAATAAVAAGSFRDPLPVQGSDEIGDLARSFNQMATRLRQMDETKQDFFARISHELRSPLTSVREAAHLLREGIPGSLNSKQARLVDIIGTSSDRLLKLVNQLLELSRIRAGILPMAWQRVDLERLVVRVLEEVRPQAEEAGVALTHARVGADVTCLGDEDRLTQVVVNLVGNAIRFTPAGGSVTVRAVDAGRHVELHVEDTGIGIPAAALPTIFESYQQAHHHRGGTGLGLAIVRGMVDAHGGRVAVESEEGKGSHFIVTLPREQARTA
jgi:signal transduction histidine kinase